MHRPALRWVRRAWDRAQDLVRPGVLWTLHWFLDDRETWMVVSRNHLGWLTIRSEHPTYDEAVMVMDALDGNPLLLSVTYRVMPRSVVDAENEKRGARWTA